jgi:hypothetical protein
MNMAAGEDVDPLLFAALARYESRFDPACVGGAGERGLLQIHPCHKRRMRDAGLDFDSEVDRLSFAASLYKSRGLQPWTVRAKAQREYRRLKAECEKYANEPEPTGTLDS